MKTVINTNNAPAAIGPYSQAILAGNTLYISGQIPMDPASGTLLSGSIADQTHQVFKNLHAILQAAGMDWSNVVKASVFLSSMEHFAAMNEVYADYFSQTIAPARETVAVQALPRYVDVEISMIAVKA